MKVFEESKMIPTENNAKYINKIRKFEKLSELSPEELEACAAGSMDSLLWDVAFATVSLLSIALMVDMVNSRLARKK